MDLCRPFKVPVYIRTVYDAGTLRLTRHGGEGSTSTYVPVPLRYRDPIHLDEVALEYSDVPIIVAHMGDASCGTWRRRSCRGCGTATSITPSPMCRRRLTRAAQQIGADRMIWGRVGLAEREAASAQHTPGHEANLAVIQQADLIPAQREAILAALADLLNSEIA